MTEKSIKLSRIQRERRAEILEAALSVFSQNGYRGASIDKIAVAAGMSRPRLLYHFKDKENLYLELLESTLSLWIAPLERIGETDNAIDEICDYVRRKLEISRLHPRESRLFANEILVGIERADDSLFGALHDIFEAKTAIIKRWTDDGLIAAVDPVHLLYSIWATTQHYADFNAQIKMLSPEKMDTLFADADRFLVNMYQKMLEPDGTE